MTQIIETTDASLGNIYTIAPGDTFRGALADSSDNDWLRFDATTYTRYIITVQDLSSTNIGIYLKDASGDLLSYDNYWHVGESLTWLATSDGPVFLDISNYTVATYQFSITATPPVTGTEGDDVLSLTTGHDTVIALGGNDLITGLVGRDFIVAGAGDDTIEGNEGRDTILGGGTGADQLDGSVGFDMVDYSSEASGIGITLGSSSNSGAAAGDSLTRIEAAHGTAFDDSITGNSAGNLLRGGAGADTIAGGAGNDRLWGWSGDDRLSGGAGDDTLRGGTGAEVFVFATGGGADVVRDFADGEDRLELDAALASGLSATQIVNQLGDDSSGATVLTFTGGETITLDGFADKTLLIDQIDLI